MRRYSLIILSILLAVCIVLAVMLYTLKSGANAGFNEAPPKYIIYMIPKAHQGSPDFWWVVEQGAKAAEKDYPIECIVTGPEKESDIDKQIEIVREAIAAKPNAIVLAPSDFHKLAPVCAEVKAAGINLVLVDSNVDFDGAKTLVSTDNFEIGQKLGQLVNEMTPDNSKIGVIGHVEVTSTAIERLGGLADTVANYDQRIVEIDYCDGSALKAKEQAMQMIEKYPDISCIVGLNETSALGISYALQEKDLAGDVVQISCDSSQEQIGFMENGTVQACVVQNPFNMGYLSVEAAVKVIEGKQVEPFINTQSVIIKKEDMYKPENQKLLFPYNESIPSEKERE